jgi:hypothetical protein
VPEIALTRGQVAIVDDADFAYLSRWKWQAKPSYGGKFYVVRQTSKDGKRIKLQMHRVILGVGSSDKRQVDHINCNGLDNRRSNLRFATRAQQQQNTPKKRNNKCGFKGVRKSKTGRWHAQIVVSKKLIRIGTFDTPELAHEAYKNAAITHFGEFARF